MGQWQPAEDGRGADGRSGRPGARDREQPTDSPKSELPEVGRAAAASYTGRAKGGRRPRSTK